MNTVREDITKILERNERVESDKAWEVSWTRRICIAIIIYGVACVFLWMIQPDNFALGAAVPTVGYLLSTMSLPFIKGIWVEWHSHDDDHR